MTDMNEKELTRRLSVRVSNEMFARLIRYWASLAKKRPGMKMADAHREILEKGLPK